MSTILVLAERAADGSVKKVTLELLTLAARLGEPSAVVIGAEPTADALAKLAEFGAANVVVVAGAEFDDFVVAPTAEALAAVITEQTPAAVLIPSTAHGKEVAARVAVRLGSGIITDAVDVDASLVATQPVFGGATVVHSRVTQGVPLITVRPNSIPPVAAPAAGTRVDVAVTVSDAARTTRVTNRVTAQKSGRPDLAEAAIVVSGGRGVGGAEGFTVIEGLADALGAAVGASRAATDAGWYPHSFQVGQTGKTVSPQLYVANGISGAIQHRAGMQTSKTVVVVNKDAEAPIFELADFGVVGDLFAVVPQLTDEIARRKA